MRFNLIALAAAASVGGLLSLPAHAGVITKTQTQNAASACTLSIPTTDTGVRPKATGFRNEGNKSAFVICSVDVDTSGNDTTFIGLTLASFDGASHGVNCTAVARYSDTLANIQYLTLPPLTTAADGSFTNLSTLGAPPSVYDHQRPALSVTCTLPPGAAIMSVARGHKDYDSYDGGVPSPMSQCSDGIDNDLDGFSDFGGDTDCQSFYDNDESQ